MRSSLIALTLILSLAFGNILNAQLTNSTETPQIEALNNYIFFANECTHGMLIVHGLLYRFNQDLNEQIDKDSYRVNFYSNADLPKDIFADEWFYDVPPYDWYDKCVAQSKLLASNHAKKLNASAGRIKKLITEINNIRFTLEKLVKADMNVEENSLKVYDELQRATDLYEQFYGEEKKLYNEVREAYKGYQSKIVLDYPGLFELFESNYRSSAVLMHTLYNKSENNLESKIEKLHDTQAELVSTDLNSYGSSRLLSKSVQLHYKNLQTKIAEFTGSINKFFNKGTVPAEYAEYGKYYYYYNKELISKFNRFGNGIVFEINSILDYLESDQLRFMELPHFYLVRYPKKLKHISYISSDAKDIQSVPRTLEKRNLVANKQKISSSSGKIELNLFDHFIEDGDIISVNFNGQWVIDSLMIKSKPFKLRLNLNPTGVNYIILHAIDQGSRPPVTMAVSYDANGREKRIIMKSDENTSEYIELNRN